MNQETKTHSKLGASSAKRWMTCPGSVSLCEQIPSKPSSVYAEEGTNAHALMEFLLKRPGQTGPTALPNAFWYIGREKEIGLEFKITEEMAGHVQEYVDKVMHLYFSLEGAELHVEKKFHLKHIHPDLFGTSDTAIVQPFGEIHVIDFKYGAGVAVDVAENEQLLYYGLGAAYGEDYSKIFLHVHQPRADHKDGTWRTWQTTPEFMVEFSKLLKQKALETQKKNAPLSEGDHCRWCAAAAVCPKLYKKAVTVAQNDFADVTPKLPEVQKLTDQQLATILEHRSLIEKWFTSVEEFAQHRLIMGEKIPGLKLVKGRSRRVWRDEAEVENKFKERIYKTEVMTPAQAEKVLGKDTVAPFIENIEGALQVAPETDKRKAITNAKDDFGKIEFSAEDF